jgi:CNT family concentrative nucleoside transporter
MERGCGDFKGPREDNPRAMEHLHALAGIAALVALSWALSERRGAVRWRLVAAGLVLQALLAALLLLVPWLRQALFSLDGALQALDRATGAGTSFVFGYLGGGPAPFEVRHPEASFVLAFRALPLILVVSALSALLFHWRILPAIVRAFSWVLEKTLGLGGAVGLSAAANVFVGMVEAPLVIKPYLARLTRAELFVVMVCGMATTAGTVMALYAAIVAPVVPDAIGHILVASIVATPAAITVSALMVPGPMSGEAGASIPRQDAGAMDAITRGTVEGVELVIQVVAMLLVLVALVHLANAILGLLPFEPPLTLQRILGEVFAPLAWTVGVPWAEARAGGALLGTKTVLNELIAYVDLAKVPADVLSPRSKLLMTYALCGFANFGSLGILIGGMGAMVPGRRHEIVSLGLKSIVAGTIATCMTAAVVGLFV